MYHYRPVPDPTDREKRIIQLNTMKSIDCWFWIGKTNKAGYVTVTISKQTYIVTRVVYKIHHPDMDHKLLVCHSCNNPIPDHLYLDNHAGNTQYSYDSGRSDKSGSKNCKARLNEDQVRQIRSRPYNCVILDYMRC